MANKKDSLRVGGSRINPMLINDPLYRAKLYDEIRRPKENDLNFSDYEISVQEALLPEIAAVRFWNDETLSWVVMVAAELDDPRREIEAGITVRLPSVTWLRNRIRYYQTMADKTV